jgi:hypothetical protein
MPISPLAGAHELLLAHATDRSIAVVTGFVGGKAKSYPQIAFEGEDAGLANDPVRRMQLFIECLSGLDVAMFVVNVSRFDEESFNDAVNQYEDALDRLGGEAATSEDRREARRALKEGLAEVKEIKAKMGEVWLLIVKAITRNPTTLIGWTEWPAWREVIDNAEKDVQEIEQEAYGDSGASEDEQYHRQEAAAFERERRFWTAKRRNETARKLAESPDFSKCKREADRVHMLRLMLGDETPSDEYMLKEMTRAALAVYRLEIAVKK